MRFWLLFWLLLSSAAVQAQAPHVWNPADTNPRYHAQKEQSIRHVSTSTTGRIRPLALQDPLARPACFEPFDSTGANGWLQLARNDDNSIGPVNLGWDFSLFGTVYNQVYINNNGNITFNSPLQTYSAIGFPTATPMIAAFWADVDTRHPNSGVVNYKVFPDRLVVVWHRVGYYNEQADKLNTFQLVIKANTAPGFTGDDVLISYDDMQWTTGDASQGTDGFSGVPATVGANRGNGVDFIQTGSFNLSTNQAPNQPTVGSPGGVNWLDGKCLSYRVGPLGNVPPAVAGLPANNTITLNQGETQTVQLQFSGPEINQTVSVSAALNGLCNAAAVIANNNDSNPGLTFTVTGSPCNIGTQMVTFTAVDNALPTQGQSVFNLQVVVNPPVGPAGQWTGVVSTAYADPANWSNNLVPGSLDDVTIPATAIRMPVVSTNVGLSSLTIASGASMTIDTNGAMRLRANLTNNGTLTGAGTLLTVGSNLQSFDGANGVSIGSLTVAAAGLQLNTGLSVSRLLTLNGNLASNGRLTLLSSATGTAMVVNNGTAAVTGAATVQRYIDPSLNPGTGYRHLTSPVTGTTLADLGTAAYTPVVNSAYNGAVNPGAVRPFPTVFSYNQSLVTSSGVAVADFDKGWVSPATVAETMQPGRGYTVNVAGGQTVDFVGTLGNGGVTMANLSRSAQAQGGWHLLGNPYPAPLDWNLAFLGANGLDNAVHVYKSSGTYAGGYASFVNGVGVNGGSSVIPMGQGFFVRVSSSARPALLALNNAARLSAYNNAPLQRTMETRPLLLLSLTGAGSADQAALYCQAGATAGFDRTFDAPNISAGKSVLLALEADGEALAVSGLPPFASGVVTVPLLARVSQTGTYTLRADELLNLPSGTTAELHDALTGTVVNLRTQPAYTFTADAALRGGRFTLVFNAGRALANAPAQLSAQVQVFPNPAHEQLWLSVPAGKQDVEVVLYNTLGQQVLRRTLPANRGAQALPILGLTKGVYSLCVTLAEGAVTKRVVIE